VGDGNQNGYIYMRSQSIKSLVESMDVIDTNRYINPQKPLSYRLAYRFQLAPLLRNLNNAIVEKINSNSYDLVWFEKPIFILKKTLRYISAKKGIYTVSLNPDNPFGPRNDGCWGLYLENIHLYSHHIVMRRSNYKDLKKIGIKKVHFIPLCYEKNLHFKEKNFNEDQKELDVTFIGTPYDNRINFIGLLSKKIEANINVYSTEWKKFKKKLGNKKNIIISDAIYQSDYRNTINKSRIMLGFITRSNADEISFRSFEITACGSFLLSERTIFQQKFFKENKEAAYFDGVEECANKINYYLDNPLERIAIESAGHKRVQDLNLTNDSTMKRALSKIF